jgi:hypothetical protein
VLIYRPGEFSFDIEPQQGSFTSVIVNELNLEVDEHGKLISVWGYCPYLAWEKSTISPPHADRLEVFAVSDKPFLMGLSLSVDPGRRWPVFVDQQSGWVCLDSRRTAISYAEVLTGVVLGFDAHDQLAAIYLKPLELPEPAQTARSHHTTSAAAKPRG